MEASAWNDGGNTYGVRVGYPNRRDFFDPQWKTIEVEIEGQFYRFELTPGFWNKCTEFRDRGEHKVIREWLQHNYKIPWEYGNPPKFELTPLGNGRFQLAP